MYPAASEHITVPTAVYNTHPPGRTASPSDCISHSISVSKSCLKMGRILRVETSRDGRTREARGALYKSSLACRLVCIAPHRGSTVAHKFGTPFGLNHGKFGPCFEVKAWRGGASRLM